MPPIIPAPMRAIFLRAMEAGILFLPCGTVLIPGPIAGHASRVPQRRHGAVDCECALGPRRALQPPMLWGENYVCKCFAIAIVWLFRHLRPTRAKHGWSVSGQRTAYGQGARRSVISGSSIPNARSHWRAILPSACDRFRSTSARPARHLRHGALGCRRATCAARSACSAKWRKAARVVWSNGSVGSRAASPLSFAARAIARKRGRSANGRRNGRRRSGGACGGTSSGCWGLAFLAAPRLSLGSAIWLCDRKGLRARFP